MDTKIIIIFFVVAVVVYFLFIHRYKRRCVSNTGIIIGPCYANGISLILNKQNYLPL